MKPFKLYRFRVRCSKCGFLDSAEKKSDAKKIRKAHRCSGTIEVLDFYFKFDSQRKFKDILKAAFHF